MESVAVKQFCMSGTLSCMVCHASRLQLAGHMPGLHHSKPKRPPCMELSRLQPNHIQASQAPAQKMALLKHAERKDCAGWPHLWTGPGHDRQHACSPNLPMQSRFAPTCCLAAELVTNRNMHCLCGCQ